MTHDELLDAINKQIITAPPFALGGYTKFLQGLSAVVELHKEKLDDVGRPVCSECFIGTSWRIYPCPTIQAIEKELSSQRW
jgi:hypothetical protein